MAKLKRQPLYQQLAAILRRELPQRYQAGDRIESEQALATRYQVSVMTVREALSALSQEGMIDRRHGVGNFLKSVKATRHIAIYSELELSSPNETYFFLHVAERLGELCAKAELTSQLYVGQASPRQQHRQQTSCPLFLRELRAGQIGGVLVLNHRPNAPWLETAQAMAVPVVGLKSGHHVRTDYADMAHQGVEALATQGSKRVGLLNWGCGAPDQSVRDAFNKAIETAGVRTCSQWLLDTVKPATPNAVAQAFHTLWRDHRSRPDGLVVLDDILFDELSCVMMHRSVRIPEDIQIATHVNKGRDRCGDLPIIRLQLDPDEFATKLVDMLLGLLEDTNQPKRVQVLRPTVLVPELTDAST